VAAIEGTAGGAHRCCANRKDIVLSEAYDEFVRNGMVASKQGAWQPLLDLDYVSVKVVQ